MLVMGIAVLGFMTMSAQAGTIDLIVNAYATQPDLSVVPIPTKCGDLAPVGIQPGSVITYEIAVAVDPLAGHANGNEGLATIVFDVNNCGAPAPILPAVGAAESGFAELGAGVIGAMRTVLDSMYYDSGTTSFPGYNGGWGFDNSGLPIGGNVTISPGNILGAGSLAPLTWTADVNPTYPGLQPYARLGVGHGLYNFGGDDPALAGLQGGFGQDLSNAKAPIAGDGHWLMFRGTMDTSAWEDGMVYGWEVVPTNGAVFSPTMDYTQDLGGGFRIAVNAPDMEGDSFSFFLVPEPASLGLLLVGGLALIRRRR
jgi:hypothetical protein